MSFWSRFANLFRGSHLDREIDEEFRTHIEEAAEQGRDPAEVRRAFGSTLRQREESHDVRVFVWLDSLRADIIFGWRQLWKRKLTAAAAIMSLALAIGACTAAFRLVDALLLRPLPVADPGRLYSISFEGLDLDGKPTVHDSCSYPMFRQWRAAVKDQAELIAVSLSNRQDLTYRSDQEMEKAHVQYVSGWMFSSLGLHPAAGRLLIEDDDRAPGAGPRAVLSYDYWTRRFGRDPEAVGRTFRMGNDIYEIVGVAGKGFTGTDTGTVTDIFVPVTMNAGSAMNANAFWLRIFVRPRPDVRMDPLRDKLYAVYRAFEVERTRNFASFTPKGILEKGPTDKLRLDSAAAGVSSMQRDYRRSLLVLSILVALVLLIACANVANLMTAQAAARDREMALRVSIGAGRRRLIQMVLVESAWIAFLAALAGGLFAWWAAPFVVGMINPPDNPARLLLPADWRVLGFGAALTLGVTILFGLTPALRASAVKPAAALRGSDDPHLRRRLMYGLIAVQSTFCFLVLFTAAMLATTFEQMVRQPTGFSAERLLTLDTVAAHSMPPAIWNQIADDVRTAPGVERVALAGWPLLSGTISNNRLSIDGGPPTTDLAWFLSVSPGWLDTMSIPVLAGRDFRANDVDPGPAIVNETFARVYFKGRDPIGKTFEKLYPKRTRLQIVGVVRDARYRDLRGPMLPVAYVPFQSMSADNVPQPRWSGTLIVRMSRNKPTDLPSILRQEVARAGLGFRVSNIRTQQEINDAQTIRERLLAVLALFFAIVAAVLAGVGIFGVLDYSVLQRSREIGIRLAIGAPRSGIARSVTVGLFSMVLAGSITGAIFGITSARYLQALLFGVKATDPGMIALPALTILTVASLAALRPVINAVRIDPVSLLREV